ncbi:MAG: glycosyltransferase [Smithella sp.]
MQEDQVFAQKALDAIIVLIDHAENLLQLVTRADYAAFELRTMDMLQSLNEYIHVYEDKKVTPFTQSIVESLKQITMFAKARSNKTVSKIEYELVPILKEFYQQYYFFNCVFPNKELMQKYYEHEMISLSENKYIDQAIKTGNYKYDMSIAVLAFNKLDYTKQCVESILKFTPPHLNYELILINHGSSDGTKEYFESIAPTKQIDILVNGGGLGAYTRYIEGKYLLLVSNDVLVTENAISNLLQCMESDEKIAWVVPTTPNVSNLQTIPSDYTTIEEMYEFAKKNNEHSNPYRWEQRVRLCNPICLRRTSVAFSSQGVHWSYYFHTNMSGGFVDDRESLLYRRNGYKLMLAKDSYCYHFGSVTLKDEISAQDSLNANQNQESFYIRGRRAFYEAFGVDPWGAGFCWSPELVELLPCLDKGHVNILGLNCGLGSNPLKIKETIKGNAHNLDVTLYNVTNNARYLQDLRGISDVAVFEPHASQFNKLFPDVQFNYIVLEDTSEKYSDLFEMIKKLYARLTNDGILVIQVVNQDIKDAFLKSYPSVTITQNWCVISATDKSHQQSGWNSLNTKVHRYKTQHTINVSENKNNQAVANVIEQADILYQKGEIEKAIEVLVESIKIAFKESQIYYELARMFIETKKFSEAWEVVGTMPDNAKNELKGLEYAGYAKEGLGLDDEAAVCADKMLTENSSYAPALNLKGVLEYKKGNKQAAEDLFKKAIIANPGYGEAHTNLGVLYWGIDKKDEALLYLKKGFVLSPTIPDISSLYYSVVSSLGKFTHADADFLEAVKLYPSNRNLAFLYIDILIQQGKFNEAMLQIEDALAVFGLDEGTLNAALAVREKIGPLQIEKESKKGTLSLCMIVKNEEINLVKCLISVRNIIDEIIIVDTGSTDKTMDIARVFGANVFDFPWTGDFSTARNHSLMQATGEWILVLDADEVLSPLDFKKLNEIIHNNSLSPVAYSIVTRNYTKNASVLGWTPNNGDYPEEAGPGWFPGSKVRLFNNRENVFFSDPIHETLEYSLKKANIPILPCNIFVHHYGAMDDQKNLQKGEYYYQLGKMKYESNPTNVIYIIELARQAQLLERYEEAAELWLRLLSHLKSNHNSPDYKKIAGVSRGKPLSDIYIQLASAYMMLARYGEALETARKAMESKIKLKEYVHVYAHCEIIAGSLDKAFSTLEELLKTTPDYPPALLLSAVIFCLKGKSEKAQEILHELLNRKVQLTPSLNKITKQLHVQKKNNEASLILHTMIENKLNNEETMKLFEDINEEMAL